MTSAITNNKQQWDSTVWKDAQFRSFISQEPEEQKAAFVSYFFPFCVETTASSTPRRLQWKLYIFDYSTVVQPT